VASVLFCLLLWLESASKASNYTLARDPFGNTRAGFEGTSELSRKDFGLTWNVALETGGFLVSDNVKLQLDISAIKQ